MIIFFRRGLQLHGHVLYVIVSLVLVLTNVAYFFYVIVPPIVSRFVGFQPLVSRFVERAKRSTVTRGVRLFFRRGISRGGVLHVLREGSVVKTIVLTVSRL